LRSHPWPGNIRELEHTVERAVILNQGPTIQEFELPDPIQEALPGISSIAVGDGFNIADALRAHEREMVIAALQAEGGVQARAAKCLGVSRANLNYRIQKLGIVIKEIVYD
jgi:DNA-binding NtrC family response regulator